MRSSVITIRKRKQVFVKHPLLAKARKISVIEVSNKTLGLVSRCLREKK